MLPRLSLLLVLLSLVALATAAIIPNAFFGLDQGASNAATISECGSPDDILRIEYIHITPDPPVKGEELTVDFKGYLKEQVEEGSMIDVTVKYGAIKLLHKQFDLCEQAQQVNRTCPIEEGDFNLIHTVELPKDIPPGKYTVLAKVFTEDVRQITCLNGVVIFRP
ncbi:ML domain-containing protein [Endogone sp. FLAS-F59071]|nr:ML domain-containing protein [Endogone sp. FLAS-F59071]|eukprot:RUS22186.1 ML domain-containing protein [Endogone sp. FLAS-F59071]